MVIENLSKIAQKVNRIKAKDIMSRFAITTNPESTVTDLAHLLMRFKISGVPVVSKNGEIMGIITATDLFEIMKKITIDISKGQGLTELPNILVKDVMTKNVISVTPENTLLDIIILMSEKNIHTLPVVSGGEIVGIIGRRDVMNAFYSNKN